ncbi:MAG TPA: hypothetical protein VG602_03070 [Actinomycetota bacterium]|nr:hypothetical protein [Actinomycetota bacterium]
MSEVRLPSALRRLLWGLGAAAAYVAVVWTASVQGGMPVRLLFDGPHPQQPYNFVDPPTDLAARNLPAQPGEATFGLLSKGVIAGGSVSTGDGQAGLTFPAQTFAARPGQEVVVTITPQDPLSVGPPPDGLAFDGNAYTVRAEYRPSGQEASPEREVTALLRYPVRANTLLRWDGSGWSRLESTNVPATLQVYANTDQLGTFVAAGPPPPGGQTNWIVFIPLAAIALAAIAGFRARRRQRTKWTRQGTRRGAR